jgi:DNA-binding transcriptional ArsR family regulator
MDPKSLRVFLSVADALNFSRVSEISHMSVSAVSRIIARLEDELGVSLLQRDRRSMRLTSGGAEFVLFGYRQFECAGPGNRNVSKSLSASRLDGSYGRPG